MNCSEDSDTHGLLTQYHVNPPFGNRTSSLLPVRVIHEWGDDDYYHDDDATVIKLRGSMDKVPYLVDPAHGILSPITRP